MALKQSIKTVANQYFTHRFKKTLQLGLLAAVCSLAACQTTPPVQEMSDARQAIAAAKEAGAAELAAIHLRAAENYLDSAEQKLGKHAYGQARREAKQAKMKALDALKASETLSEPQSDFEQ